jgi:outer membrane protein TolC
VDRASADFLPKVRLEGNYAYSAFQYDSQTGPNQRDNTGGVNGFAGFLAVDWDIFDGFERVENLRKRRAEELAAREELESKRLATSRDVWVSYHDTLSASRRVEFAEGYVASAQENFQAVETAYQAGLAPVAEYADSAGQLALARSARADAVADYSTTLASLALAVGSLR